MYRFILMSICFVFLLSANFVFAQEMSKEQKKVWEKRQKSMPVEEFKKKIEGYETATEEAYKLERQVVSTTKALAARERRIDSLEKALANYQQGKGDVAKNSKLKDTNSNKESFNSKTVDTDNATTQTTENTTENNTISSNSDSNGNDDYSTGTIFRVQIGAFRNKDLMKFVGHKRFHAEQDQDGVKKYTIAAFRDYWEADLFKKYMREMGVKDAWIVGYKDGVRVQIESVLSAEDQSIVKAGDSKNNDVD